MQKPSLTFFNSFCMTYILHKVRSNPPSPEMNNQLKRYRIYALPCGSDWNELSMPRLPVVAGEHIGCISKRRRQYCTATQAQTNRPIPCSSTREYESSIGSLAKLQSKISEQSVNNNIAVRRTSPSNHTSRSSSPGHPFSPNIF
jgi:hypothetical protein